MINMFHDITSLPYVSVWLNKKTHNPWMRIAWSEALGLFSEKTKKYTTLWYVAATESDNSNFILKRTPVNEEQQL